MKHRRYWVGGLAALGLAAVVWAAVGTAGAAPAKNASRKLTKVTLQLKWVTQAQFAGYYAAKAKGFYQQQGLDLTIRPGGPDIIPESIVASGQAQFGIDWLSSLMTSRDKKVNLVNIAQVFTKSGLTLITWKNTGLNSVAKLKNKTVANWLGGNEFEVFAALVKNGMDPVHQKRGKIFKEPFTMDFFLNSKANAASTMAYNELAQMHQHTTLKTG